MVSRIQMQLHCSQRFEPSGAATRNFGHCRPDAKVDDQKDCCAKITLEMRLLFSSFAFALLMIWTLLHLLTVFLLIFAQSIMWPP